MSAPSRPGPFDEFPWPEKLAARVVTPGKDPRIHGYDVERDLARGYRFGDLVLLALVGELPSDEASRAFDVALSFLAPTSIAHAPVHGGAIARICNGTPSAIAGTCAVGLAEMTRSTLARHAAWTAWLRDRHGPPPPDPDPPNGASVDALRAAILEAGLAVPALDVAVSRDAALIAVLYACGLTDDERMLAAVVTAKLPVAIAESLATPAGSFRTYPARLPPIAYEE